MSRLPPAARLFGLIPGDAARAIAVAWTLAALVAALGMAASTGPAPGEGEALEAAARHGGWWTRLPANPIESLAAIGPAFDPERGAAPLPTGVAGVGRALFGGGLPGGEVVAFRLAAALFSALLAYVLSRSGGDVGGPIGAALAPALLLLVPAAAAAAGAVGTAVPAAALWLGVLLAHLRGLRSRDRRERFRRAAVAGILFGAAVATRRDAWALLPLVLVHYLVVRARGAVRARDGDPAHAGHLARGPLRSLVAGLPSSIPAMALLGPVVFAALAPWTWVDPFDRMLRAIPAAPPRAAWVHLGAAVTGDAPWHAPLIAALLLLPGSVALLHLAGLGHGLRRLRLGWRGEAAASFPEELLLLLGALVPLGLAATGVAPSEPGIGPALPALAVTSLLGARAVSTAARRAWPSNAAKLAAAVAVLALYPAARATVRTFPHGAAAWGEWIGGAPGAASLGLPRGAAGSGVALLGEVRDRAMPGQRLWWPGPRPSFVEALQRAGRLRPDLRIVASPEEADLAILEHDEAARDLEYRTWTAFGSARPVAAVRLDEVPLASLYARPGAWR